MRLEVPPFQQEYPWSCLAACVRMCLAYSGRMMSEQDVRILCGTSPLGTSLDRAAEGIRTIGLEAVLWYDAELERLYDHLALGEPVIVAVKVGGPGHRVTNHATVVIGADGLCIFLLDPASGQEQKMDALEFQYFWDAAGGGALFIREG